MKRHGIVNSSIAKVLADLGHTDWIVIGDLGLPVPKDIPKIDLAIKIGTPTFQEVVKVIHDDMVVEKVIAAEEIKTNNPAQLQFLESEFSGMVDFISHEQLKQFMKQAKAVIRTGEATPYSNCILQAGVIFSTGKE
ncbi:D-ribose pyranase [Bacillus smithii]|jgi:D-ribose pyranase|uniref:D-ribose pyranase n=1 Tax=Bacillus smithii TaxID=1479 RepID=UPI0022E12247|nr:D-ribose pyranase [Bacillus smithii]MED1489656.1 D-ribose pyranase [Bacillus smithii]